jgi:hypothetical protein
MVGPGPLYIALYVTGERGQDGQDGIRQAPVGLHDARPPPTIDVTGPIFAIGVPDGGDIVLPAAELTMRSIKAARFNTSRRRHQLIQRWRRPDQRVDTLHQRNAIHCRLQIGMSQLNCFVVQDVAGGGHADRLHMGNDHMVRSILQHQQLGDNAVLGVHVCVLRSYSDAAG